MCDKGNINHALENCVGVIVLLYEYYTIFI